MRQALHIVANEAPLLYYGWLVVAPYGGRQAHALILGFVRSLVPSDFLPLHISTTTNNAFEHFKRKHCKSGK